MNTRSPSASRALKLIASACLTTLSLASARSEPVDTATNANASAAQAALMRSGICIARAARELDDRVSSAALVGQRVALQCTKEIQNAALLATRLTGKGSYGETLTYMKNDLTSATVQRLRDAQKPA